MVPAVGASLNPLRTNIHTNKCNFLLAFICYLTHTRRRKYYLAKIFIRSVCRREKVNL